MGRATRIRRRGKVKVTRSQRKQTLNNQRFRTKKFGDATVKAQWNHKETARQNFERLGLQFDPNKKNRTTATTSVVELFGAYGLRSGDEWSSDMTLSRTPSRVAAATVAPRGGSL